MNKSLAGRLRIVCKTSEDDQEIELPFRVLFFGNFKGEDERPLEERVPVRLDRDTFPKVLAAHAPRLNLTVPNHRRGGTAIRAQLVFRRLSDFGPDGIAEQVPETLRLLALRDALTELKASGNVQGFRARAEELVVAPQERARLLAALGVAQP